jgi:serine protease Do
MRFDSMICAAWLAAAAFAGPAASQQDRADRKDAQEEQKAAQDEAREQAREAREQAREQARHAREQARQLTEANRELGRAAGDARNFLFLRAGGAFLGIGVAEIDSERAKVLKLKEEHGVEVTSVEPDSPAQKAGLKQNDVVLEYNGQRVEGTEQFMRMVRETPAGRQVRLTVSRGGAAQNLAATLGTRKNTGFSFNGENFRIPDIRIPDMPIGPMPPMPPDVPRAFMALRSGRLGVEGETLTPQLAEYFGVKEGVLIRSVVKGSAAEKAGIKAGDVIVKLDNDTVTSPRELSSAVRAALSKKTVPVSLYRDRKQMTVTVTLEAAGPTRLGDLEPPVAPVGTRGFGFGFAAPAPPAPPELEM